jgi:hypothetical protein
VTTLPLRPPSAEAAARIEADIAILQRLAEIAMQMVELTAARALQEAQPDPEAPKPARPRSDPFTLFTRLAKTVRDTIALKTKIAGGIAAPETPAAAKTRKDPRRPFIAAELDKAVKNSDYPAIDRPALKREIEARLTDALAADPDFEVRGGEFVMTICNEYGLSYDIAQFPDELLLLPGEPIPGQGPILRGDDLSAISRLGIPPEARQNGFHKKP